MSVRHDGTGTVPLFPNEQSRSAVTSNGREGPEVAITKVVDGSRSELATCGVASLP